MANKSINDLPEGMVSEILVRLPVKSLLQCKSVCKPWLSLISTPHFVQSQLLRAIMASMNTPTLLSIEKPPLTEEELARKLAEMDTHIVTLFSDPALEQQQQRRRQLVDEALLDAAAQDLSSSPVQFHRLVMPRLFSTHYSIKSVCNGILCLANSFGNVVYLWNPSISKFKKLPAPEPYTCTTLPVKVGFGYDPISDDYKVFRVVSEKEFDVEPLIQVYSSNADSWTSEFKAPILKNVEYYGRTNVVVDGVLYFDNNMDHLISFDLHNESFGLVPIPSLTRMGSDVLDFQGSVAMVFQSGFEIYDLWTLDNVSGDVSWTKKFSIEAHPETEIWLTKYLGAAQFFGKKLFDRSVFMFNVLYDYEKKETKIYKHEEENVCAFLKYKETLVSLDGFEQMQ
ncbi:F-box/kelch-repeat protein At3g23880-like [Daucus carota subsp. sativus]|uniref:F-box/kelch-repeat protein At3g23880-like n=1 Tax=Daucus carota subsp. sativus TaxID=79200 RepID=UPI0007EF02B7|nr:PREDICTED: F-box/kelch-repeat protein At3g23880-like [Daucus carota subsp. sativus]